jgi:hypothetical protein
VFGDVFHETLSCTHITLYPDCDDSHARRRRPSSASSQ